MADKARDLKKKLRRIEALHAGATTDGERLAAEAARTRILQRLEELEATLPVVEHQFNFGDIWSMKLMVALCRRYGLEPYRHRHHEQSLRVRAPARFVHETLWPEYQDMGTVFSEHLQFDELGLKCRLLRIESELEAQDVRVTPASGGTAPIAAGPPEAAREDPLREFSFVDIWSVKLMQALCRRYELKPHWYPALDDDGFVLSVRAPERFIARVLRPVFDRLSSELLAYLKDLTERVIASSLHEDLSEPPVVPHCLEET